MHLSTTEVSGEVSWECYVCLWWCAFSSAHSVHIQCLCVWHFIWLFCFPVFWAEQLRLVFCVHQIYYFLSQQLCICLCQIYSKWIYRCNSSFGGHKSLLHGMDGCFVCMLSTHAPVAYRKRCFALKIICACLMCCKCVSVNVGVTVCVQGVQ